MMSHPPGSPLGPRPPADPCGPEPTARAPVQAPLGYGRFASDMGSGSSFRVRRQWALAQMRLSAGGLRCWVIQQAEAGACRWLLVRFGPEVKIATAAGGDSRPALPPWMASISGREH
jgi:hypothetical protein